MAALAHHNQAYSSEPQDSLQWNRKPFEGEDVLDEHILDSNTFDMAAVEHQRRESFASSASILSPTQQTWQEYAYCADTAHYPLNNAPSLFPEHSGNQLSHPDAPQYPHYGNHMAQWQPQGTMGSDTAGAHFQSFAPDVDTIKPEIPYNNEPVPPQHPNVYGELPVQMDSEYPPYAASAASPQWSTSSSDAVEKIPRSGHFQSPMYKHNIAHLPRDGVRKKNARFDIPEGHNLQTIDELINRTDPNNEQTLKELKQQKRLLRNRQAAYVPNRDKHIVIQR